MILDKRDFSTPQLTATLLISIENTISDLNSFFKAIHSIKRRFGFNISVVFKHPELLFFNKRMMSAIANAEIDRALITDTAELIWLDVMEFAKRQETDYVVFSEAESLVSDWSGILKFITSNLNSNCKFRQSKEKAFTTCKQSHLRTISSEKFDSYKELIQSIIQEIKSDKKSLSLQPAKFSLFTSKSGINRFGGLDRFKKIENILFGNKPICDAKKIWQIDNQMELSDFLSQDLNQLLENELVTIPGILAKTDKHQIIVDINPGCGVSLDDSTHDKLCVPRMLLTISIVTEAAIKETNTPTTFIMSNFNKAPYIASALYGIAIQTHQNVNVEIIDDISTDQSVAAIESFSAIVDKSYMPINFSINEKSKGTYWIRNSIIQKFIDENHTYFVNDSDDFSSSQRANIQLAVQEKNKGTAEICFGDIVRVDSQFTILPLDGKVERYGTASLGAPTSVHKKYGYYENIRKNADTEFIERLRHFSGKQSTKWFRYPLLFQPFDGKNLTSDIYSGIAGGAITENLGGRMKHRELFLKNFQKYSPEDLIKIYTHPNYSYPIEYIAHLKDFIIQEI